MLVCFLLVTCISCTNFSVLCWHAYLCRPTYEHQGTWWSYTPTVFGTILCVDMRIYVDPHMNTWEPGDDMHFFVVHASVSSTTDCDGDSSKQVSRAVTNNNKLNWAFYLKYIFTRAFNWARCWYPITCYVGLFPTCDLQFMSKLFSAVLTCVFM